MLGAEEEEKGKGKEFLENESDVFLSIVQCNLLPRTPIMPNGTIILKGEIRQL